METPGHQDVPGTARLPVELVVVVAEFLSRDLCFGSLANLNRTCRLVHAETLPALYEMMEWDGWRADRMIPDRVLRCQGWKFVK
jgi:hypothetical protein